MASRPCCSQHCIKRQGIYDSHTESRQLTRDSPHQHCNQTSKTAGLACSALSCLCKGSVTVCPKQSFNTTGRCENFRKMIITLTSCCARVHCGSDCSTAMTGAMCSSTAVSVSAAAASSASCTAADRSLASDSCLGQTQSWKVSHIFIKSVTLLQGCLARAHLLKVI